MKTKDHLQKNHDAFPFQGEPNLAFAHLQQNLKKDLIPSIASPDYTALMELDIATA